MKTKPLLKWLGLAATSTALSLAPAYAAPEKEADNAENKVEKRAENKAERAEKRADNQTERADDKADRVEKRVENQTERRADNQSDKRATKQSERRTENHAEQRAENQAERRADNQAEKRAENQAERRADNMAEKRAENQARQAENQAEKRADRIEDRREDRADRREIKQRFEARERDRIVGYFGEHKGRQHGLPPELATKWQSGKRLPSGWRDRVVSGYVIEESWMPSFHPVPYSWFPEIAVIPDTRLYWYGDRVVRVFEPRREVVDVVIIPSIHIDL